MTIPKCPTHHIEMVLRTAKKGRNAGNKFWGCPTWATTKCNHTFPFIEENMIETENSTLNSDDLILPRLFSARPIHKGFHVRFFESAAVPIETLEQLDKGNLSENSSRVFSQWRLDYPENQENPLWKERERHAFAVIEKILTRGRITLCSPYLENEHKKRFPNNEHPENAGSKLKSLIYNSFQRESAITWLDSPAEKLFFQRYLVDRFGPKILRWIIPQVEISSLLSIDYENDFSGRVDFLFYYPNSEPIIIEIDGQDHNSHTDEDSYRDTALVGEGFIVIRIPSNEIETFSGPNLQTLEHLINKTKFDRPSHNNTSSESFNKFLCAIKISHQIQLVALQAIQTGYLNIADASTWKFSTDLVETGLFDYQESLYILKSAIADLILLMRNTGNLYSIKLCNGLPQFYAEAPDKINLSFTGISKKCVNFFIQEISLPFHIANSIFTTSNAILDKPTPKILQYLLTYIFRKKSFWEGQLDAISRTLEGKDSIVLLPTGAGKSIAFQLASLLLPGRALVIDPIVSLMEDQIDNLRLMGIDRAIAITSQIADAKKRQEILTLFGQGEYLFAYISPLRFQTIDFRKALRSLTTHTPISLIAVDEAHCVSEWGHDFMTAYLNIGRVSRKYCESGGVIPPLLALTGTASRSVLKDVQRELQIEDFDAIITPKTFDRPELKFHILSSSSEEKSSRLMGYLGQSIPSLFSASPSLFFQPNGKSTFSGLVFCPHVNGNFGVVEVSDKIQSALGISARFYSGKQPKYYKKIRWDLEKKIVARKFKHNEIPLLVCTKAFGMGIDKPNIRFTIHFGIPPSIESFYQEAGRAGRDRKTSHCCILISNDYPDRSRKLLDPNTSAEEIQHIIDNIAWNENDDITRILYFQSKSFPGVSAEMSRIKSVLNAFPDYSKSTTIAAIFSDLERNDAEKALHRLLILDIISDYTIKYNSNEFTIKLPGSTKESIINAYGKYISGYLASRHQIEIEKAKKFLNLPFMDFALQIVNLLLSFIYDVIERGRRRALYEMVLVADTSNTDSSIRNRILKYLTATEYSETIENILKQKDTGLQLAVETFHAVRSPNEAAELRGQVSRYLESYPDHPSLLMLRALSELFCKIRDLKIVNENFRAAISSAKEIYSFAPPLLYRFIVWAIQTISQRDLALARKLQLHTLNIYRDRNLARELIKDSPPDLAEVPAFLLVNRIINISKRLISYN